MYICNKDDLGIVDAPKETVVQRIERIISSHNCVLFMKGEPMAPKCGFSSQIVQILKEENVSFQHYDIIEDEELRQALKDYSKWPTYPQLYVAGKLIGGLDIVKVR
jgi:Grx4 family monothiol glutaredoxin